VHRTVFLLSGKKVTKRKPYVLHTCDNPACARLGHLYAGSPRDNVADMIRRGRHAGFSTGPGIFQGEENGRAKLTWRKVQALRRAYATGRYSHRVLALMFNISKTTVHRIIHDESWKVAA